MSKLDDLLDSIHPDSTYKKVSSRANSAFASYSADSYCINNLESFKKFVCDFYGHVLKRILQTNDETAIDTEVFWGSCCNILEKAYGFRWHITILEMCTYKIEHGLYGILKIIVERIVDLFSTNEISSKVTVFWEKLSRNERLEIADEYLEKFGHLIPFEFTEGNATKLRMNMLKILENHPKMLMELQKIR